MKSTLIERLVNKRTACALHDYQMIADGERVLVAVSGQDSLTLLHLLNNRLRFVPIKYKLIVVHINLNAQNAKVIEGYLKKEGYQHYIVKVDLSKGKKKDIYKTPCFWCSWKRREAIFKLADKLKCKKIVLAHHLDDIIETYLLNIFFQGEVSSMPPKLRMFDGEFHLIRPFAYLEKKDIARYARIKQIPKMPYECPYGKTTNRAQVKKMISSMGKKYARIKESIFRSMSNIHKDYLPKKDF